MFVYMCDCQWYIRFFCKFIFVAKLLETTEYGSYQIEMFAYTGKSVNIFLECKLMRKLVRPEKINIEWTSISGIDKKGMIDQLFN